MKNRVLDLHITNVGDRLDLSLFLWGGGRVLLHLQKGYAKLIFLSPLYSLGHKDMHNKDKDNITLFNVSRVKFSVLNIAVLTLHVHVLSLMLVVVPEMESGFPSWGRTPY